MKNLLIAAGFATLLAAPLANAETYLIDTKDAHASINFKVQHLGYSWLTGRFNNFSGDFNFDPAKPEASKINVTIDTNSLDSNHAERDKHLRSDDFLDVSKFPEAKFVSTKVENLGDGKLKVTGDFTLHGITKPIVIDVNKIGEGKDPWGGYRAGFEGTTVFKMADYGITKNLGPASANVMLSLHIEGVQQ